MPLSSCTLRSLLALATLLASCGEPSTCPPTGPPPLDECLDGSDAPGCELPLSVAEGPLRTDVPYFECVGWGARTPPVCLHGEEDVETVGSDTVVFWVPGLHGDHFVLDTDPESGLARFCTEYSTDVFISGCPVGGENWRCATGGTVTVEEDPPAGAAPLRELRAVFPGGEMVHAVW